LSEARAVFLEVVSRILESLSKRRASETVKWLTDLMYYANMNNMDEQYLKLFNRIIMEVENQPETFQASFTESLNATLDKMKRGSEAALLLEVLTKAEKLKMERLEKYITPPETFKLKASKILDEVFGG
jgi:hypothetical protein